MPRLIFVNRYFFPDHSATSQMLSDLAFGLTEDGYSIVVVTSRLLYSAPAAALPPRETVRGVAVRRVWTSRFGRHNLIGRAVDYATFYLAAAWAVWRLARRGDVVIAKTDPPLLSVVLRPLAAWRGARTVNWLQDVFPEVAEAVGMGGGRLRYVYEALAQLRDRSLKQADMNVAIGERMAEYLLSRGVPQFRIRVIPNWSDCDDISPVPREKNTLRARWGLGDAFVVGYSGNLGRAHDIATLIEAIRRVEQALMSDPTLPRVRWLFIGSGALFEILRREIARQSLTTVHFKPYQPREHLSDSLSAADVHLVSLRPELEGVIVPSKFYGVAAAGRPTIFIGAEDGEIARVLRNHDCGETVQQGDAKALTEVILRLSQAPGLLSRMGRNAREACVAHFDRRIAALNWNDLLKRLN